MNAHNHSGPKVASFLLNQSEEIDLIQTKME